MLGWMLIGPVTVELATIESGNHFKRGILRISKLHNHRIPDSGHVSQSVIIHSECQ